ncbi:myelin-associated glycoprotein-like isoform X3 [Pantherophis guttatus]|uniref:Myelin-associated glycoprotein-like isoform X3 n=1 Tax=Pantherophis guttatus TaxID=94885 RepID=A0A6P9CA85_PANGU|nr:myelin-associated glycoprotein-like isoform X3 [Pantherophis guttatus]
MKPSNEYLPLTFLLVLFDSPVSASWSSILPSSIQALKGSCVVIPCSFTFPDSWDSRDSNVAWYQYHFWSYPEIYNSKTLKNVLPAYQGRTEVVGNLQKGNCTLSINPVEMEDAMRYYVWINPGSVNHPFHDVTVQVVVTDVPNQLELSDLGLVTEGDPTQVSCSVLHTCPLSPPILTWNLDENKAVTIQEYLTGGSWRTESSFNYIPSHKDHGRYLRCTATFPNKQQIYNGISLNIQYPPKNATILVIGNQRLKEGDDATLRCESHGNPPPTTYHWFFGPEKAPLKVADKPVIWPESNCTISKTEEMITCYCVAEGNPPPRIEWNLLNLTIPGEFNSSELQADLYSWEQTIVSILRVPGSNFTQISCKATNQHGTSYITLPTIKAGNITLLLIGLGGAVAGLVLFTLLGILVYKVTVSSRKKEKKQGEQEEEQAENPRIHGNGEEIIYLNTKKPSKDNQKEEQLNMCNKPNVPGSQADDNELSTSKAYENMEMPEDYENISTERTTGYFGISDWQFPFGSDQLYSNV